MRACSFLEGPAASSRGGAAAAALAAVGKGGAVEIAFQNARAKTLLLMTNLVSVIGKDMTMEYLLAGLEQDLMWTRKPEFSRGDVEAW